MCECRHDFTAYMTNEGSNDMIYRRSRERQGHDRRGRSGAAQARCAGRRQALRRRGWSKGVDRELCVQPGLDHHFTGESVTWSNDDGSPHALVFNAGVGGTVSLSPGQSFTRTFAKAGTYDYPCSFHPYMMAKVVVA